MPKQTLEQMESDLKLAGFTEYFSRHPLNHEHAVSRWQLKVYNNNNEIKYFVHAFLYKKYGSNRCIGSEGTIEFEAILYPVMLDNEWITLQLHGCSNVRSSICFFAEAYIDLGCKLDRHNN